MGFEDASAPLQDEDRNSEADLCAVAEVNKTAAITMDEIIQRSQKDEELQGVKTALHDGK